jgi:hypothetical protein
MIPAFMIGPVAACIPGVVFWAWNRQLLRGVAKIPRRSLIALGVLTVLTPMYLIASWDYGIRYQGRPHTLTMVGLNVSAAVLNWVLIVIGWRAPSFGRSVAFHTALFGWLAWCAFPYLGELP